MAQSPRRKSVRRYNLDSFRRPIKNVTAHQSALLDSYVANELKLYNILVDKLYARLKSSPGFFSKLTSQQTSLFGALTRLSFDVRKLNNKKSSSYQLHESLTPYKNMLFGIQGGKEIGMSDALQVFYTMCSTPAAVLPEMREAMALELLDFCKKQCVVMSSKTVGQEYKTSPETLETLNNLQKRHIQIPKANTRIQYDANTETSKLFIPHFKEPLIIDDDLTDPICSWSILIIHRDPGKLPLGKELPWEAEFRQTPSSYLIKYMECKNPISQMRGRFVGMRM